MRNWPLHIIVASIHWRTESISDFRCHKINQNKTHEEKKKKKKSEKKKKEKKKKKEEEEKGFSFATILSEAITCKCVYLCVYNYVEPVFRSKRYVRSGIKIGSVLCLCTPVSPSVPEI